MGLSLCIYRVKKENYTAKPTEDESTHQYKKKFIA
jgi:hypothetical protein